MAIKPVSELVAEARLQINGMPIDEAIALHGRDDVLFVDIRDYRELERDGRIPSAFHAPRGMLEFWIDPASPYHKPGLSTGKKMIFFCASAWRSALAVKALQDMGVENIFDLQGGFKAWKEAGGPLDERD